MTAIKLLEKLGADATYDPSLLSIEDKKTVEEIIQKAKQFIACHMIVAPDEESEEQTEDEPEEEEK